MSMPPEPATRPPTRGLAALGTGDTAARLSFRAVLGIFLRCIPLLRPVALHLVLLVGYFVGGFLVFLMLGLGFGLTLWDVVLQGHAADSWTWQAALFGMSETGLVGVDEVSAELRSALAEQIVWRGALLIQVGIAGAFVFYYYQTWILQRINQVLRVRLLDRMQQMSLRFHSDQKVGDTIYRAYQDSAMVTQVIGTFFLSPLYALIRVAIGLAAVSAFDPIFAGAMLGLFPIALLLGYWFSRRLRVGFRTARETNSALTSRIQESLLGIRVIKAYGLESFERGRFEEASLTAFDRAFRARAMLAVYGVAVFWLVGAATLTAFFHAADLSHSGAALWAMNADGTPREGSALGAFLAALGVAAWTLGLFNGLKALFTLGSGAVNDLSRLWGRAQDVAVGLDRVFELLDLEPEVQESANAVALAPFQHSIVYKDVSFAYQPVRPVLEGVSFEARAGTITSLVGPTGSGKTTIVSLLLRLYDPDRGAIEIDGVDLRELRLQSLRTNVSIALQENVLFGRSVRENIRFAKPGASDEEVRAAAEVACADEFIRELPEGYDTELGERGAGLSTGQRQRISIARAILKDAPILVLDEPTAALDAETEARLIRNLAQWGRGRCVFLITHRLSTIRMADQIVFLRDGRIVEKGAHEELMAREGSAYRDLVEVERDSQQRAES